MKLQRAFTERKRLTKRYEEICSKINCCNFSVETYQDGRYIKSVKLDLDLLLDEQQLAGEMLAEMNAAIDEANANSEARFILSKLVAARRRLASLQRLNSLEEAFEATKEEYDAYRYDGKGNQGMYITKYYRKASEKDFEVLVKEQEKFIRDLEDKLSEVNATTEVDVPQTVLEYIKNI